MAEGSLTESVSTPEWQSKTEVQMLPESRQAPPSSPGTSAGTGAFADPASSPLTLEVCKTADTPTCCPWAKSQPEPDPESASKDSTAQELPARSPTGDFFFLEKEPHTITGQASPFNLLEIPLVCKPCPLPQQQMVVLDRPVLHLLVNVPTQSPAPLGPTVVEPSQQAVAAVTEFAFLREQLRFSASPWARALAGPSHHQFAFCTELSQASAVIAEARLEQGLSLSPCLH